MLFRAIALSIALLVGVGTLLPLATDEVQAGPKRSKKYRKGKKYKKYSKRWWRQYRARQAKKRSLNARKRALRLRQLRLAKMRSAGKERAAEANAKPRVEDVKAAILPSGQPAPPSWKPGGSSGAEVRFRLQDGRGAEVGTASISVVGPATGESIAAGRHLSLGGVPTTALRREVINRMIQENGWVVNDFQKEVGGKPVYVVVAQSQSGGSVQSRMFYFTETDGRIYSVATNTPLEVADQLAAESEKVIQALQARPRPVQQAAKD